MMKKRMMALVLALAMMLSMAACGGSGDSGGSPGGTDDAGNTGSESGENTGSGDVVKIKMAVLTIGDTSDGEKVVAKANEMLASDGLAVEIQYIKFSDWKEQTNLLATGGKGSIDILPIWNQPLATQVSNGSLMAMDDLYAQYKDQLEGLFTESQMRACYYNGILYGIPTERDLAINRGFVMRKDILDELGYKAED